MQGLQLVTNLFSVSTRLGNFLQSLALLAVRISLFQPFFNSGLTKIQSWSNTLLLFQHEYRVPVLPPQLAATLATVTELTMPILLLIGLGARIPAIILFVFNIVAVVAYYHGLSPAGLNHHITWGVSLLALVAFGPGKFSLDFLLIRKET